MVWLPAVAVGPAELSATMSGLELEPSLVERMPWKSVRAESEVERVERPVPMEVRAVPWDLMVVS